MLKGISAGILVEAHTNSINLPSSNGEKSDKDFDGIRRFACPVGFFRLKRNCYYLSAGIAPWREAYFHCKDRNSTLAELDKNGKDRILRKYLMGEQFSKWISILKGSRVVQPRNKVGFQRIMVLSSFNIKCDEFQLIGMHLLG